MLQKKSTFGAFVTAMALVAAASIGCADDRSTADLMISELGGVCDRFSSEFDAALYETGDCLLAECDESTEFYSDSSYDYECPQEYKDDLAEAKKDQADADPGEDGDSDGGTTDSSSPDSTDAEDEEDDVEDEEDEQSDSSAPDTTSKTPTRTSPPTTVTTTTEAATTTTTAKTTSSAPPTTKKPTGATSTLPRPGGTSTLP